jgi:hypothetical protein
MGKELKDRNTDIVDPTRSRLPPTETQRNVDELIRENRFMTMKEMTAENGVTVRFRRWWKDCNTRKVLCVGCLGSYVGAGTTETKAKTYFLTIAGTI